MAILETTIGSGKDRATVTLWHSMDVGNFGTDTYKGIIQEDAEFNENVTLTGGTGTPSITSYIWLTTDPANRHAGVAGTGHGRMRGNSNGSHVVTVDADFTRVEWLEIQQDSTGNSDEAIRMNGVDNVLIDYCILWTDQSTAAQDGIRCGSVNIANWRISNCIIYGWSRAGIHFQYNNATLTIDVDHCTIYDCGDDDNDSIGAIRISSNNAGDVMTIGLFNTWGDISVNSASKEAFADGPPVDRGVPTGTVTWNGSHNLATEFSTHDEIDGTDNTTDWQDATSSPFIEDTTQTSGSFVVVTSKTGGSEDLTLLDDAAGNLAAGNGTDRQGSEPDARQDFSTAIDGTRPTVNVDIGASQVSSGAVTTRFIRSRLQSRQGLQFDADRLVSTGLISAQKST